MDPIATHSIEEGLDFAFNLLIGPVATAGRADPSLAAKFLSLIEGFVRPRYAGEPEIALHYMEVLASTVPAEFLPNHSQIEKQIEWLRTQLPPGA